MIRIRVTNAQLLTRIEQSSPGWLDDAKAKKKKAVAAGNVAEGTGTWSEVKEVYIALQHHKCAYCELPMAKVTAGSADHVAVDYDVEHFRPKNRVTPWPNATVLARRPGLDYAGVVNSGHPDGYVRFAFEPTNYVVSCKVCNSSYKADRFPIAGTANKQLVDRAKLDDREKPLLLYPLGDDGDDPADYLGFYGPMPGPIAQAGDKRLRARVLIDFFELDVREDLIEGRCHVLLLLHPRLVTVATSTDQARRAAAARFVEALTADTFPHAACARAFARLHARDAAAAQQVFAAAEEYLISKDRSIFGPGPT